MRSFCIQRFSVVIILFTIIKQIRTINAINEKPFPSPCEMLDGQDYFEETDKICHAKNMSLFLYDNYGFVCLLKSYVLIDSNAFKMKVVCHYKDVVECVDFMENQTISYKNLSCNKTIKLKKYHRRFTDKAEDVTNGSHVSSFKCRKLGSENWQTDSYLVFLDADIEIRTSDDSDYLNCTFVFPPTEGIFESKIIWRYQDEIIKEEEGIFSKVDKTFDGYYKCEGVITYRPNNLDKFTSSSHDFHVVKYIKVSNHSNQTTSMVPPIYSRQYLPMRNLYKASVSSRTSMQKKWLLNFLAFSSSILTLL